MMTTDPAPHALETSALLSISEHLRTQDNRCTANPAFCVQVKERIGPMLPEYCNDLMYFDHEKCEIYYEDGPDPDEWKRLHALDEDDELPGHVSAGGYVEKWHTVQTCFTEDGCKRYLEQNGHNLRHYHGTRIYAESFNRNLEMIELREFLLKEAASSNSIKSPPTA